MQYCTNTKRQYFSLFGKKIYSGQAAAIVTDQVPETLVSGFGSAVEKWVLGKLNEAFLHLYAKF